jgi:hypothetical protein
MHSNETTCPGCEASITAGNDVEFIEIDTQGTELLSLNAPKKMYVIACGNCEVILGGGVGMPS